MRVLRDRLLSLTLGLSFLASAGCDTYPIEPRSWREGNDLAIALLGESLAADGSGLTTGRVEHACPAGGRIISEGETRIVEDGDQKVYEWNRTAQYDACQVQLGNAVSLTDGVLHFEGVSRFGPPVDGRARLLSQESTQKGTLTTSRNGVPVQCEYDVAISYDASSGEYVVAGTACGQPLNFRRAVPALS